MSDKKKEKKVKKKKKCCEKFLKSKQCKSCPLSQIKVAKALEKSAAKG